MGQTAVAIATEMCCEFLPHAQWLWEGRPSMWWQKLATNDSFLEKEKTKYDLLYSSRLSASQNISYGAYVEKGQYWSRSVQSASFQTTERI